MPSHGGSVASIAASTALQEVDAIRVYVDQHPYSEDYVVPDFILDNTLLVDGFGELNIAWDAIAGLLSGTPNGDHILYVEALDTDGYYGPIAAVSFSVETVPTKSPMPSTVPSDTPSNPPSLGPTPCPSSTPTSTPTTPVPTTEPTQTASPTDCIDNADGLCNYVALGRLILCDFVSIATTCRLTCGWCDGPPALPLN